VKGCRSESRDSSRRLVCQARAKGGVVQLAGQVGCRAGIPFDFAQGRPMPAASWRTLPSVPAKPRRGARQRALFWSQRGPVAGDHLAPQVVGGSHPRFSQDSPPGLSHFGVTRMAYLGSYVTRRGRQDSQPLHRKANGSTSIKLPIPTAPERGTGGCKTAVGFAVHISLCGGAGDEAGKSGVCLRSGGAACREPGSR
jgi:hypothetical protein